MSMAAWFSQVTNLISLRKQQIAKLDELVKARFVEMFGEALFCQGYNFVFYGVVKNRVVKKYVTNFTESECS